MWSTIVQWVIEALVKVGLAKKQEADAEKGKALEKTVDSVDKSLEAEKKIRDEQKAVEKSPETVKAADGGLNFDNFNKPEAKKEDKPKET
jgi:hypothetical protein